MSIEGKITHLMFELGTLKVYAIEPPDYVQGMPFKKEIHWVDHLNPKGSGPFDYIYQAMKHYSAVIEDRKKQLSYVVSTIQPQNGNLIPIQPPDHNVIRVDFLNRRRNK